MISSMSESDKQLIKRLKSTRGIPSESDASRGRAAIREGQLNQIVKKAKSKSRKKKT
jgi:hypothetical protein